MKRNRIILTLAAMAAAVPGLAQYVPSRENLEARNAFSENRLGIFLHWGIYSTYAQGEWYLNSGRLHKDVYAEAAEGFYPAQFDAFQWAKAFKEAGAGYVTVTTRHHDGFSMFRTEASDYNIADGTPFGRDVIRELADACAEEGLRMQFYYSLVDWIREDYPVGVTGHDTGRKGDAADYGHYFNFMKTQIGELLTRYGPVGAMWFDGLWDHEDDVPPFDWRMDELYACIHGLQPACLVGNNHHRAPLEGEDFQMFEKDLPGENTTGFARNQTVSDALPLEMCETMNGSWGYRISDQNYKSVKEIVHLLVRAAAKNANLLLNIGPEANGKLPTPALERLKGIGEWMRAYAPTVNGTTATAIPEQPWGVTTRTSDKIYLHILDASVLPSNGTELVITIPLNEKVLKINNFSNNVTLPFTVSKTGFLTVTAPQPDRESIDTILEITLKQ